MHCLACTDHERTVHERRALFSRCRVHDVCSTDEHAEGRVKFDGDDAYFVGDKATKLLARGLAAKETAGKAVAIPSDAEEEESVSELRDAGEGSTSGGMASRRLSSRRSNSSSGKTRSDGLVAGRRESSSQSKALEKYDEKMRQQMQDDGEEELEAVLDGGD